MDDKQKYYKWIVFLFLLSPSIACSFSHFWKVLCYKLNEKKIKNKTKFCKLLCTLGLDYFFIFFIYSKWKYFECIYNSWKQKKKTTKMKQKMLIRKDYSLVMWCVNFFAKRISKALKRKFKECLVSLLLYTHFPNVNSNKYLRCSSSLCVDTLTTMFIAVRNENANMETS